MDAEDESSTYLKYLNDPTTTFLNATGEELNDEFPFSEIESSDWQTETFPVLINPNADIELFNEEVTLVQSDGADNTILIAQTEGAAAGISPGRLDGDATAKKTYVNYSPIVKEDSNGNKEIYLTERDINNDASVIQLRNSDGTVITIDKEILNSLQFSGDEERPDERATSYDEHYSPVIAYKCKSCGLLCDSEGKVKEHIDERHAELFHQNAQVPAGQSLLKNNQQPGKRYTFYLCSICKMAFPEREKLKEHMMNTHKLSEETERVDENDATRKTKNLKVLSGFFLKQQEKARKRVACMVEGCNVRLPREDLRKKHEECHIRDNKSQFKCIVCDEKFSIWRICSNHLWKSHRIDVGLLTCPLCNKFKSNSASKVMGHMALHNDERPFLCSECGKGYKSLVQLRNHEVYHMKADNLPNWATSRWCDICERYFATSKSLKIHIKSVHENFKPFICNICGHKTTRKAMLEVHIRQHTGAKPHKCPYCEYRTGDHNCLRKHMMKHVGLYNYKCPHCPYAAIQSTTFKNHIKNRHPGKSGTYSCTFCSYTSINFPNFCAHVKRHEAASKQNGTQQNEDVDRPNNKPNGIDADDDETQNIFNTEGALEETIDTGGITIPAEFSELVIES